MKTTKLRVALAAAMGLAFGSASANAATIDLGFIMDSSGSISESNFDSAMNSLATALENSLAPTIGSSNTYVVSVVTFSSSAQDVTGATRVTIDSAAALTGVANSIRAWAANNPNNTSGTTNYQAAFNQLRNNYGAGELGASSIVNMMTDGSPNQGNSTAGRDALQAAGWDSLSFESVGSGASNTLLSNLGYDANGPGATIIGNPNQITDPLNDAFVLEVSGFGAAYDQAIKTKVQRIVTPGAVPLPTALPLLGGGILLMGFIGRRRKAAS